MRRKPVDIYNQVDERYSGNYVEGIFVLIFGIQSEKFAELLLGRLAYFKVYLASYDFAEFPEDFSGRLALALGMPLLDDLVDAIQVLGKSLLKLCQLLVADLTDELVLLGQVHTFLLVVAEVTRGRLLEANHVHAQYFVPVAKIHSLEIFSVLCQVWLGGRDASSSHFKCYDW